jgi:shikimate 5-dehydrogenase
MIRSYRQAVKPTIYFIGVTTNESSIMKTFPLWAEYLGLHDAEIKGIDFIPHADPAGYREAVEFIKTDPLSVGALVTTHKIDLFTACRDIFDEIDPFAKLIGETSCISKGEWQACLSRKGPDFLRSFT